MSGKAFKRALQESRREGEIKFLGISSMTREDIHKLKRMLSMAFAPRAGFESFNTLIESKARNAMIEVDKSLEKFTALELLIIKAQEAKANGAKPIMAMPIGGLV